MQRPGDVIVAVAFGSAIGGVARYLLATSLQERAGTLFPYGTLAVNLTGCLLIGFVMRLALDTGEFSPALRALLTAGFCGGFTTFSTFAWETMAEVEEGAFHRAGLYVGTSLLLGLFAVWTGSAMARALLTTIRRAVT